MTSLGEKAVIGALLIEPAVIGLPEVRALSPDDFLDDAYSAIFREAREMEQRGEKIDPVRLQAATGISTDVFREAMLETPTATNAGGYAAIVKNEADKRRIAGIAADMMNTVGKTAEEMLYDARTALEGISISFRGSGSVDAYEAATRLVTWRKQAKAGENVVSTGWSSLNWRLGGGLYNGHMVVIGARPGMGKTTFAIAMANRMDKVGPGLFCTLEMTAEQIFAKRLSEMANISSQAILAGADFRDTEGARLRRALEDMKNRSRMRIADRLFTLAEIEREASTIPGLRYLVIDYLGLISGGHSRKSRYEEVTDTSRELKQMSKRLNVPVIVLAQLNRETASRSGHRPALSDLRDSGAIEQDADEVILLHRPDYYDGGKDGAYVPLEVDVAKSRFGPPGLVRMVFSLKSGCVNEEERE